MLPTWAIETIVRPYGHRLPVLLPHWKPPMEPKRAPLTLFSMKPGSGIKPGNLPNSEYEFFAGCVDPTAVTSCCRGCQAIMRNDVERREHKEKGCNTRLKKAYALLCKDMKCVMCDEPTTKKVWGVPICSTDCLHGFKFNWTWNAVIRAALARV